MNPLSTPHLESQRRESTRSIFGELKGHNMENWIALFYIHYGGQEWGIRSSTLLSFPRILPREWVFYSFLSFFPPLLHNLLLYTTHLPYYKMEWPTIWFVWQREFPWCRHSPWKLGWVRHLTVNQHFQTPPFTPEVSARTNRMCFASMLKSSLPQWTKLWCLKWRYDKSLILIICLLPHKEQTWRADTSTSCIAQHTMHAQYIHWTNDKSNNPKIFQSKSSIHSHNKQQMN